MIWRRHIPEGKAVGGSFATARPVFLSDLETPQHVLPRGIAALDSMILGVPEILMDWFHSDENTQARQRWIGKRYRAGLCARSSLLSAILKAALESSCGSLSSIMSITCGVAWCAKKVPQFSCKQKLCGTCWGQETRLSNTISGNSAAYISLLSCSI